MEQNFTLFPIIGNTFTFELQWMCACYDDCEVAVCM